MNKQEAEEIMYTYHQHPLGGHMAYNNTLHKIASRYYWDNMTKDIMEYMLSMYKRLELDIDILSQQLTTSPNTLKLDLSVFKQLPKFHCSYTKRSYVDMDVQLL
ncbi:hypothetical protein RO3G_15281 [Rhizopus delemar RA 99-880]|uniref:Integrase zinc-binding domain-containing protein n=1 Tax=Rhizopus delemar (strain RA 99-880 / ATCC MYA-4621 / FGSC 9543 / NRRL 43880) TaxID=246409 RepID=I1CQ40_RHIO9|nr:hypothetical protein RO3G_15281 [Rhizopus delemar RA 99-880]|eukprot:EIE90570.1 hypothetical protein RO3G_15281 [Rhizopus delemar RA 99-880]